MTLKKSCNTKGFRVAGRESTASKLPAVRPSSPRDNLPAGSIAVRRCFFFMGGLPHPKRKYVKAFTSRTKFATMTVCSAAAGV